MSWKPPISIFLIIIVTSLGFFYLSKQREHPIVTVKIKGKPLNEYLGDKSKKEPQEQKQTREEVEVTSEIKEMTTGEENNQISTEDKEAVLALIKDLEKAWLAGDVELFTSLHSCTIQNQTYCNESFQNFKDRHEEKSYSQVKFTLEGIEKLGENLKVYVHEVYDYNIKATGDIFFTDVDYVYNLEKVNGEWLIYDGYKFKGR